ncbi:hypothetical protein [Flavobacterium beibuense]|uniref:Uncharacterized protein n=1 Tax=Flavobacterium beibuense TaxID=657326 RepID=A0A444WFB6_9FLAO|nr:hypothetical protein [Flavobacterium beibuense]RYJ44495.1 hypothetical protein NU09_1105 [Flavobacterium beibuense]
MENLKLDGFLNILFGSTQETIKEKIKDRDGIIDTENSNEEHLLYNNVKFAGYNTELIIFLFYENQFAKASIYIKPSLESRVIETYRSICNDLNNKYYTTDKDFETYDYPYEQNDGHTETAITIGKAEFSCFWNFNAGDKEDNYISVIINEFLEIQITYENGYLNNLLVNKNKEKDSQDY